MEALYSHFFTDRTYSGIQHTQNSSQHATLPDSSIHSASGSSRCGGDGGAVHEHQPRRPSLHFARSIAQPTATAMANAEGAAIEDDLPLVRTGEVHNRGPGKAT